MRNFLFLMLVSSYVFSEYEFEISKFESGKVCDEMIGGWYTDVYATETLRYVTRIQRNEDGSAFLKGIAIDYEAKSANPWEFPSDWSCSDGWYVEKNEWGYTAFKIKSLGGVNVFSDSRKNINDDEIDIIESKGFMNADSQLKKYFGIE